MSHRTVIPFGPQHPVLPEPIQLKLVCEGEKIVEVIPNIGYIHRGIEKGGEIKDFQQTLHLIERTCGICSFIHALTYSQGIEDLLKMEVPPRAKYLRVAWSELSRIHSHLLWLGLLADAIGFESLFMQFWKIRESILDLFELTTGQRVIQSACIIGGVRRNIDDQMASKIKTDLQSVKEALDEMLPVLLEDYSLKARTVGAGMLSKEQAMTLGAVGPTARASGVRQDSRSLNYLPYDELGFEPITETAGDSYARALVRTKEIYQSIGIVLKALDAAPRGELSVPVKSWPNGEAIQRVEQPRGEVFYYIKGNGTRNLERLKIRTPTFANIPTLLVMLPGASMADLPVIVLSIDPCISCTER
ncbi:MAG: nickel-dependent hydrogenase large subunit [Planctomycetes bacterium]|nr:nickel-dependent hydrogenase large subunit [Planctomycetota bacterium]